MSPVRPTRSRDARSLTLAVGGLVLGVALLAVVFAFAIPQLTESGTIRVNGGSAPLPLGDARARAEAVARDGPIPFADPTGGSRDVLVQHLGDDPLTGWTAFDARRPGTGRRCTLRWDPAGGRFTDPCGGPPVPADGGGLPHYRVDVDRDGQLAVQLVTPTSAPTSSLVITGSAPR